MNHKIKTLPCKCHGISREGMIFSRLYQTSVKGKQGIQTLVGDEWNEIYGTLTNSGYLQVAIHGRTIRTNRLIASNFIPNPLCYPEVQHKDDNKLNNTVSNLKWGNQKHNADDRKKNGHQCYGSKSPKSKLNESKVREIKELREQGISLNKIAEKYGVSKKLILLVVQNKIWRHVQ